MAVVRFRERMAGALVSLERAGAVTVPARGPACGDGLLAGARARYAGHEWVHPRDGLRIEVRGLDVELSDERVADGFRAVVRRGTVTGLGRRPARIGAGFADLAALPHGGRRLYYRLAVEDGDAWFVLEGAKEVRGVWWETTALFTRVMRVAVGDGLRLAAAGSAERLGVLAGRLDDAEVGLCAVRDFVHGARPWTAHRERNHAPCRGRVRPGAGR